METNWYSYRGRQNADGSLLVQRGRPPARPPESCLNCLHIPTPDNLFVTNDGSRVITNGYARGVNFPHTLTVELTDVVRDSCPLVENNTKTGKPNYLAAALLDFFSAQF